MAESVRGLTIKIGGDTSEFNAAIKTAKSAASTLQTQLRSVEKALKFDPTSVENTSTKFELLKDRAQALASKLDSTKTYMEKLGQAETKLDNKKIAEIAAKTDNAALAAKQASEDYSDVTAELASLYDEADKAVQSLGSIDDKFATFRDAKNADGITSAVEGLRKLGSQSEDAAEQTDALATKITEVYENWEQASLERDVYASVAQFEDLNVQAEITEAEIKNIASRMVEVRDVDVSASLTDAATSASEAERHLEEAKTAVEQCGSSSVQFKIAQIEVKNAIKQTNNDLKSTPSEIKTIAGRTDDVAGYVENARDGWIDVNTRLSTAKGRLSNLKRDQQKLESSIETAEKAYDRFSGEIGAAADEVEGVDSEQKKLKDEIDASKERYEALSKKVDKASEEVDDLCAAAEKANEALSTAEAVQEYDKLVKKVKALETELDDTAANGYEAYRQLGDGVRDVGQALTNISNTASSVLEDMMDSAYDVSDAYYDMRKTVEGTEQEFEDLYEAAINYSSSSVTSADELLEIMAMGGQLGIATEELEDFAEVVSNISVASDVDADTAAEDIGQLAAILDDLDGETYSSFSDSLVRLGNNTATTESSILDITTRIGSMGSIVGLTTPQMLALSATVASTGMNSEAAGTALSNTLSNIETAVAAGGDSLKQFAKVSGMSASEFKETWNNDPIAAIQAFVEGLNDIEGSGGSADATLEELGITGTRQKQAIEGLMQTVDDLDDNLTMSEDAWNGVSDAWGEAGDAANEAEKKSEGFAGELQQLKNNIQNIGAVIGDALTPYIAEAADILADVTECLLDMSDSTKTAIVQMIALTAAIGPVVTSVGNFFEGIGNIRKSLMNSKSSIKGVTKLLTTLGKVTNPLTVAITALGAAFAAVSFLFKYNEAATAAEDAETARAAFKDLDDVIGDAYDSAYILNDALGDTEVSFEDVDESVSDTIEWLADFNEEISDTYEQLYGTESELDSAWKVIKKYGNQTDISATETTELQIALDTVNDVLGTNYSLHEDTAGKIYDEADARVKNVSSIKKEIEAYKDEAELDAIAELLGEATSEVEQAQADLVAAKKLGDESLIKESQAALDQLEEDCAYWNSRYTAMMNDLSDDTVDAIANSDSAWQESFSNIMVEFKDALGDDFTEDFESNLTGMISDAIESGNWSEVRALAEEYGIDINEYLQNGIANGGGGDNGITRLYSQIILGMKNGNADTILEANEGLSGLADAITKSIDDGTIAAEEGVSIMTQTLSGVGDTAIASLAIESEDPDVQAAIASYIGVADDMVYSLSDAVANGMATTEEAALLLMDSLYPDDTKDLISSYVELGAQIPQSLLDQISEGEIEVNDETMALIANLIINSDDDEYVDALASAAGISNDYLTEILSGLDPDDETSVDNAMLNLMAAMAESLETESGTFSESLASTLADATGEGIDVFSDSGAEYLNSIGVSFADAAELGGILDDANATRISGKITDEIEEAVEEAVYDVQFDGFDEILASKAEEAAIEDGIIGALGDLYNLDLSGSGTNSGKSYAEGLKSDEVLDSIGDAANLDAEEQAKLLGVHSPTQEGPLSASDGNGGEKWGENLALNFAEGLSDSDALAAVKESASDVVDKLASTLKLAKGGQADSGLLGSSSQGGYLWGKHLTQNWASGLADSDALASVKSKATTAVQSAADVMQNSVPKEGPFSGAEKGGERSGRHLVENIAAGIVDGIPTVVSAAEEVSDALKEAIEGAAIEAAVAATVETAVSSTNAEVDYSESKLDRLEALLASLDSTTKGTAEAAPATTINQTFETKVVRADADLYTAAPIIYRSALNEAQAAMI